MGSRMLTTQQKKDFMSWDGRTASPCSPGSGEDLPTGAIQ